ncbi:MAG: peptidase M16 [Proteobacteria bacterium]|nr:MAG: peptidase M16 [Pseudomonadota bacterium]
MRHAAYPLFVCAALALAPALPTPALAAAPSPSPAPAAAAAAPNVNLRFEKYTLDNGLEVVLHRDPAAPLITVNVWYHVGSGDEVVGKSGFAHLFEHMMFQGTKHTGQDVHFKILEAIGASEVNGSTTTDRTNYYQTVPRHHVETALWLESDRMGFVLDALTEESFRNQVDVVRNERRQRYDNQAYGRARFALAAALYPEGHPYRYLTIGLHEDLDNASLEDVRAFFRKWYVPSNATLVVAGDFEIADMKALVAKWFGTLPTRHRPKPSYAAPPTLAKSVSVEVSDPFAKLAQVQWVWLTPANLAKDSLELMAAAEILGAQGWGRLYKRLVVDEQLCSVVWAGVDPKAFNGELHVVARVKPGLDRDRVSDIIKQEVDRLVAAPPSAAELNRVVVNTESAFVWSLEDLSERADQLQWFNHYTGDPGFMSTYLARLRALTPAAVHAAAARWLTKPHAQIITVPAAAAGAAPNPSAPEEGE